MTDLSRVILVAPHRTLEMALPAMIPLADLLPVLVQRATGAGLPGLSGRQVKGLTGEGDWVLQRLGGPPLDEELTPASLQIRDGETLYLRPRDTQLPPVHFDDLIDGLATGVRTRPDRWTEPLTRSLFLVIGAIALGTCLALLLDTTFPRRGPIAGTVAMVLVFGTMMCSRALGDAWAAVMLGLAALPFAALFGYTILPATAVAGWSAPHLLCAAGVASVTALVVTFALGKHRAMFLAIWIVALAASAAAMLSVLNLSAAQGAATIVTAALMASAFAPAIAFRLALMRLPQLPTSAADLSEDIEPYPGPKLISGAIVADTYLTWMLVAVGLVATGGTIILATAEGPAAYWFVVSVTLVMAIRSRGFNSGWQRAATLLPAVTGWVLLAIRTASAIQPYNRAIAVPALLTLAAAMVGLSRLLPGRRLLPYWGRYADAAEYVVALAMVILLLAVFDAFAWARALAG